jgi:MFS family permease
MFMKKVSAKQKYSAARNPAIPAGVWTLGFVSLFMDISSGIIHSLLPVFLVSVLGASVLFVGLIEGIAAAAALITKVFSGVLSDYLGRRKVLVTIGYALSALTKPVFAIASSVGWVMTARITDRLGKGIRGAPRDAWLGDITPVPVRGASFGLRQSLDTVGAFVGPLLAILLMALFVGDIRRVFWFATIPAVIAVAILWFGIKEPERAEPTRDRRRMPIRRADLKLLGYAYWGTVVVGGVLTLARFSEAFLVLRAADVGLSLTLVPVVFVVMNIAYAAVSYPAGRLSDRIGRHSLLAGGFVVLIVADLVLATASNVGWVLLGVTLWGIHMGLTHGVLAALIADTSPARLRGTAFGIFNLVSGMALLLASLLAGWLWGEYGAPATFYVGAIVAAVALPGMLALRWLFPHSAAE